MSSSGDFGNPLRKFKLVFLGEQSGKWDDEVILFYDFNRLKWLERNFMSGIVRVIRQFMHLYRMCGVFVGTFVFVFFKNNFAIDCRIK
jgi:hypothetical protein